MRRKNVVLTVLFLLSGLWAQALAGIGSWRSHYAYHNATQCVAVAGKIYVVSDGSLYSYSPTDEFVECYDKTNILNDQGIRHIAVDEATNILVVIYSNANIDLIYPDGGVVNITDFKNKIALDPMVNDLRIMGSNAYLATNFGITILNIERGEFVNTYELGRKAYSCVELGGIIYVAAEDGVYLGDTKDNLLDVANWKRISGETYAQLAIFDASLIGLKSKGSVYQIGLADGLPTLLRKGAFNFMHSADGKLFVGNSTNVFVYDTLTDFTQLTMDGTVLYLTTDGTVYWTGNGKYGLNGYRYDEEAGNVGQVVSQVIPNSPIRNYCQYLNFVSDDRLLVAGGCLNYYDDIFYDGTLMMYEEGTWTSFQEEGIAQQTGVHYKNMTSIVQDPKDENHHYASSFGQGLYEFKNMQLVGHYNHKNSLLESVSSKPERLNYTRVSHLLYDKDGNLWITNADGAEKIKSPLKVLKPDGEMISLYYEDIAYQATVTEVLFHSSGLVWVVSMRYDSGLLCIDLNGTLENTSDDRTRYFDHQFVNQDGQITGIDFIEDIEEDVNGDIWVMTNSGPYVLYSPTEVYADDYTFTKIKVPRNDGTNYADYLLDGVYCTCVETDAANRKWIGTLNNGLYLISGDGMEMVHHFTVDNSPLPSNTIESLALHHASGELFVGTDKGLVSYQSDATRAENEYNEEKVYAYPNPVMPDYNGVVTVVGLKVNSSVKIVNTAGRLVAEGTSLGGSFTWDGKTPQGQRVATGMYYVLGSDEMGNEGIVTKILFVK